MQRSCAVDVPRFLDELRLGTAPWVRPLDAAIVKPPEDFVRYAKAAHDAETIEETFFDAIVETPMKYKRVISGGRCLRLRSLRFERFVKQLFVLIHQTSPVPVALEPWDLSHGHMVVCDSGDGPLDFLVVFHAKEFPAEYRHSTTGPVLPIGDPAMGGAHDPRAGTRCSVSDANYYLRNYVYALSSNALYLLDPKAKGFASVLLGGNEFYTVDEWKLGSVVGDINYLKDCGVLACPRHAFGLGFVVRNHIDAVKDTAQRATAEEMEELEPQDAALVGCLRDETAGKSLAGELSNLRAAIRSARTAELQRFLSDAQERLHPTCIQILRDIASDTMQARRTAQAASDVAHKEELLSKGVASHHAEEFLEHTSTHNGYSALRAMQLLEVVHPQYRSAENSETYGTRAIGINIAKQVCSCVFYADSALEAIHLHETERIDLSIACSSVLTRREATTRLAIRRQQQQQQQQQSTS